MRLLQTSFSFILLFLLLIAAHAEAQQSAQVILAGYHVVPPVQTSGSGTVTVELKKDTLSVHGQFKNLTSWYTGTSIMVGKKGETGNQLYRLNTSGLNESHTGGAFKAEENSFVLNEAQLQLLKEGSLYINVISDDHPRGELRGQIPPMG